MPCETACVEGGIIIFISQAGVILWRGGNCPLAGNYFKQLKLLSRVLIVKSTDANG